MREGGEKKWRRARKGKKNRREGERGNGEGKGGDNKYQERRRKNEE